MPRVRGPADRIRRYKLQATAWVLAYAAGGVVLAAFAAQVATNPDAGEAERVFAVAFAVLAVLLVGVAGFDLRGIWRNPDRGPR